MPEDLTIRIDLNAPVTLTGCTSALRAVYDWWLGELVEMLPASIRDRLRVGSQPARAFIDKDTWYLESDSTPPLQFSMEADAHDIREDLARRAPLLLPESVDVALPRTCALFRTITVPVSALPRLRQVVRLQLDRLSPFRGDDVQFDSYAIGDLPSISASPESANVLIEVVIISKQRLFSVEKMLRGAGLVPRAFGIEGSPARFSPHGLPWAKRTQHRAIALLSGILLFSAAMLLGPMASSADIDDLRTARETMAPLASRALAEHEELVRYQLPQQALSAGRAAVLDVILDLTRRLPDDINLTRLEFDGNQLVLEGMAPGLKQVSSAIARSSLLTQIKVLPGHAAGQFTVTARLRPAKGGV